MSYAILVRPIFLVIFVIGFCGLGAYVIQCYTSGEVVATTAVQGANAQTLTDYLKAARRKIISVGSEETRKKFLTFPPVNLTPDMGELDLRIVFDSHGVIRSDEKLYFPIFQLQDADDKSLIFENKTSGITKPMMKITKSMETSSAYYIGTLNVPKVGSYQLTVGLDDRNLAAGNLTLHFEVLKNVIKVDLLTLGTFVAALILGAIGLFFTHPLRARN